MLCCKNLPIQYQGIVDKLKHHELQIGGTDKFCNAIAPENDIA